MLDRQKDWLADAFTFLRFIDSHSRQQKHGINTHLDLLLLPTGNDRRERSSRGNHSQYLS